MIKAAGASFRFVQGLRPHILRNRKYQNREGCGRELELDGNSFEISNALIVVGIILLSALLLALLLLVWVIIQVRRINLPPNADFFTALRYTPLTVVILLDLLDLSLDFFAAPFAWVILGRLGLEPLRAVTVVESFIPFTQALPTMTIAWFVARIWKNAPRIPGGFPFP